MQALASEAESIADRAADIVLGSLNVARVLPIERVEAEVAAEEAPAVGGFEVDLAAEGARLRKRSSKPAVSVA
jgi:hypothetical protein